jgi:hypothetical protein
MKIENDNASSDNRRNPSGQSRREYAKPRLIKYGDVAKLTAGSNGNLGDAAGINMTRS